MENKFHFGQSGKSKMSKCSHKQGCPPNAVAYDEVEKSAASLWCRKKKLSLTKENMKKFLEENPERGEWIYEPASDKFVLEKITLSDAEHNIATLITPIFDDWYKHGKGLRSTHLKNYTSGDGEYEGFESVVLRAIHETAKYLGLADSDYLIDQEYLRPTVKDGPYDAMRMDHNIWMNNRLAAMLETRAWVDKPFYELKRNVIQTIETMPYCNRHLTDATKFLILGLNIDIQKRLIRTQNVVCSPSHEIVIIPLSNGSRSGGQNYFDNGLNPIAIEHLARFLHQTLLAKV